MRKELGMFLASAGPFDLVDASPLLLPRAATRSNVSVARSVQPPLAYTLSEFSLAGSWHPKALPHTLAHAVLGLWRTAVALGDWTRSTHILSLGQLEHASMARWLPPFRGKLSLYRPELSDEERSALGAIRRNRRPWTGPGIRFLWMGRWAPHKGVKRLAQFIGTRLEATSDDTVTIAGCGRIPEGPIARHLIASNRVRIIPHYRREELRSLLESHDVGLFTSDVEGWGLSLNEMVEAGLPVFATNTGGVPDMKAACDGCILPFPPPPSIDVNACRAQMMKRDPPGGRTGWDDVADLYEALITTHRTRGNGR